MENKKQKTYLSLRSIRRVSSLSPVPMLETCQTCLEPFFDFGCQVGDGAGGAVPYIVISKVELKDNKKKTYYGARESSRTSFMVWCNVATARAVTAAVAAGMVLVVLVVLPQF